MTKKAWDVGSIPTGDTTKPPSTVRFRDFSPCAKRLGNGSSLCRGILWEDANFQENGYFWNRPESLRTQGRSCGCVRTPIKENLTFLKKYAILIIVNEENKKIGNSKVFGLSEQLWVGYDCA